ncbi:MAG: hypothetical protein CBB71_14435 [Rhodopirellula sp. TMED11]|nr:MAG: hypothetical protein CBB71_14435 [Rhodopirellula sp. TMED11]
MATSVQISGKETAQRTVRITQRDGLRSLATISLPSTVATDHSPGFSGQPPGSLSKLANPWNFLPHHLITLSKTSLFHPLEPSILSRLAMVQRSLPPTDSWLLRNSGAD